ncbi:MAG: anhydro-N-acetylmuramic acid kinase [Chloroflexi bacterium AL-W]|nr:anhydro-N-acetylmuramic acid kinase [Chloroflexi bacterium AL-N1]NOK66052.1 anhydro-N-acetylmuramic acid kinase [Chloroflexi bacterium AL-N10]NOK72933.1 anhydro-N-acetylmuramic acid kinase [Chloroflexi bacterium AL-N5]NOK79830.1 anhydro-N-acetylmuramic acid kinase [Chloroflexi bacterium AL-W]NOK88314.1 anhydro-N-acetylmuramic acid kinase [Chloroflexi bacterium AL-N15]
MHIIGLMSGTSLDAIDAALIEVTHQHDVLYVTTHAFVMYPFEQRLRDRVYDLLPPNQGSTVKVAEVHMLLGEAFAMAAMDAAHAANIPIADVDLIASHGQTVYHQIGTNGVNTSLQLGNPAVIAEWTGRTVVADFRTGDIAAGGHGAPLVPYLDTLLFRKPDRFRVAQNIGGIGNVTYLPPRGDVIAFDTGPGNVLIDETMRLITNGRVSLDQDGHMAAQGTVDETLLNTWLAHPYFLQPPPKSAGREQWGPTEAQYYLKQGRTRGLSDADMIATLTAFTAHSIASSYQHYLGDINEVIVSGGGARNQTLLHMLQDALLNIPVYPVDHLSINAEAKEAIAFALIGYATLHDWPNNIPSVTGATHPVVMGNITPGPNYRTLIQQVITNVSDPPTYVRLL